jgi:hypothetical protein
MESVPFTAQPNKRNAILNAMLDVVVIDHLKSSFSELSQV